MQSNGYFASFSESKSLCGNTDEKIFIILIRVFADALSKKFWKKFIHFYNLATQIFEKPLQAKIVSPKFIE